MLVSSADAEETFPYVAKIKAKTANLRAGQNENFEIIGQLKVGEEVVVVAESYTWRKVKLPSAAKSYVSAGFIKDLGGGVGEVTGNRLNIRATPAANASIVGQLKKGELIGIVEKVKDWYRIEPTDQSYGWVLKEFLEFKSKEIPAGRVVQAPIRNIYVKKRLAKETAESSPGMISSMGTVEQLAEKALSDDIRHRLKTDGPTVYYLQGYRHVLDSFYNQKVQIKGRIKPDFRSDSPVILVTRINLVL